MNSVYSVYNGFVNDYVKNGFTKLNLSIQSMIELWLVHKDMKKVVAATFDMKSTDDTLINYKKEIKDLIEWVDTAGMFCIQNKDLFYVSKSEVFVKEIDKIMWKIDCKSQIRKGELFGYPKKAVEIYAKNPRDKQLTVDINENRNVEFWMLYMRYAYRAGHIEEDGEIAKKWAGVCRADIPNIAMKFEREMLLM